MGLMALTLSQIEARVDAAGRRPGWAFVRRHPLLVIGGALLATGLTAMIAMQAFVNLSVVLGLVPTKGIPLPFMSYGGSSMFANMIAMGILLNITQHATAVDPGGRVKRAAHTAALDELARVEG
jgi:hypothetical protein